MVKQIYYCCYYYYNFFFSVLPKFQWTLQFIIRVEITLKSWLRVFPVLMLRYRRGRGCFHARYFKDGSLDPELGGRFAFVEPSFSSCFQIQWDKQNRHLEEQLSEHRYQVNARHQLRRIRKKHSTSVYFSSFHQHFFRDLAGFLRA